MAAGKTRVLMVCMGNICRSPTAEGVLRAKLLAAGLQHRVEVDSAGTHGYHVREAPDPRAKAHAARRGYDLSPLRARRVVTEDFERFDHVLAMDEDNLAFLAEMAPKGSPAQVDLLMAFARQPGAPRRVGLGPRVGGLAHVVATPGARPVLRRRRRFRARARPGGRRLRRARGQVAADAGNFLSQSRPKQSGSAILDRISRVHRNSPQRLLSGQGIGAATRYFLFCFPA
jgi:protein-tyrosine phosphatase